VKEEHVIWTQRNWLPAQTNKIFVHWRTLMTSKVKVLYSECQR
jgi:hypothetical protein